jgi:tRNA (guanine37-N1)-methyltransferase
MRIDIITIFPEYFGPLSVSLIGKAASRGDITFAVRDLREWTHDVHRTVDDSPFGGGPGMVMKPEPWGEAIDAVAGLAEPGPPGTRPAGAGPAGTRPTGAGPTGTGPTGTGQFGVSPAGADQVGTRADPVGTGPADTGAPAPLLLIPTPAGVPFTQRHAARYSAERWLIFACGRYEGIDGRVAEDARARMRVEEVSIGDYVLAGGEPAVLVMIEAICRLLPGVLGNAESAADDSFGFGDGLTGDRMAGLVEGPSYTRPKVWRDREVPPVLLSGDHAAITRWRRDSALRRTAQNRPDLVERLLVGQLDKHDLAVLAEAGFPVSGEDVAH